MIDWISVSLPLPRGCGEVDWLLAGGCTVFYRPGGEVSHIVAAWLPVMGSFESAIRLRVSGQRLFISGNPVKFLTGQNLDGKDSVPWLLARVLPILCRRVGLPVLLACMPGKLSRVDVTCNLDLGSVERVREVLRVAAVTASGRRQGRSTAAGSTVYIGQHSSVHSVKLYSKFDELRAHPPKGLPGPVTESLIEQSAGLLRCEVTVRGKQLERDGFQLVDSWRDLGMSDLYWRRFMSGLSISSGVDLLDDEVLSLPLFLRHTYDTWRRGGDLSELVSRATRYRHRKALLDWSEGRVDIEVMRPSVVTQPISTVDIGSWLRLAPVWHATGVLSDWMMACWEKSA